MLKGIAERRITAVAEVVFELAQDLMLIEDTKANEFPRDYDVGYISVDNVYMMFEPDPHKLSIFTGKKKSKLRRR